MKIGFDMKGQEDALEVVRGFEGVVTGAVSRLIMKYLLLIETTAKKNLGRDGLPGVDMGRLRASLRHLLQQVAGQVTGGKVYTDVSYSIYVHEGTKGPRKMPPLDALRDWARRVLGDEDAAYPIGRMIAREGTRANPFLLDAWNEHIGDFVRDLRNL